MLGVLAEQDLHGYEIRRRLRDELGLLANVSFGSLYPALARLEAAGALRSTEERLGVDPSVPMTGSLSGELALLRTLRDGTGRARRARRVFAITDEGRRLLAELLDEDGDAHDTRAFDLRVAFAGHLASSARIGLFERRLAELRGRLAEPGGDHNTGRAPGLRPDRYLRSVLDHNRAGLEREVAWLEGLLAEELATTHLGDRVPT